ncbi:MULTISPECIES: nitrile hydratase accessory protein [unclassified Neorhizobium]|uniref:nitrile hydratase accessory protein n=1 Tax=unclassified Neorhizobium TaxID=2629175 RepID=UPI001FF562C3|nr:MULTISPECIES: nitrile hydratase accessory protein [unclassified Neorhizobium]MCJ9670811.1 nitrile hydratase accessory protein [Neorhizobium sp. SHOUNA12B]MCJ9745388.1 nitrile hydratase accessory protein [Neorhizobium sp. SHOUNA12A]
MSACEIPSALAQSPGLPKSPEGDPVFPEPWAAEAFAMTVHLHERGLFSWSEWAEALSGEVHKPGRAEDGSDYFDCWVAALSGLLVGKGVADSETILSLQQSWQRAAEATPHGRPIELANDPLR